MMPLAAATPWGQIKGKVYDEQGKPLSGAIVMCHLSGIQNDAVGQRTDTNGNYIFVGLTSGKYTLRATQNGYQAEYLQVRVLKDGMGTAVFALQKLHYGRQIVQPTINIGSRPKKNNKHGR